MESVIKVGDVVKSIAGRDKEQLFLVITVDGDRAKIIDGKTHKALMPKLKNLKHLKLVFPNALKQTAENLNSGKPLGNERLRKEISAVKEKI